MRRIASRSPGPARRITTSRFYTPARIVPVVDGSDTATFVIAVAIAAAASMGIFAHASKHGSRHATAWGVGTFLLLGVVVPLYFVRYWIRRRPPSGE